MDEDLIKISIALQQGTEAELEDAVFRHSEQVKFAITVLLDYPHKLREEQVQLIIQTYDCSRSHAYKLIAQAQELFPSIEKVNKAFERARLASLCYRFLERCREKGNTRDAVQYLKLLKDLFQLDETDDASGLQQQVINLFKFAPETLGVKLPENFDELKFITNLEKEYEQRASTIDIEHS
jgi:hypothetical protein